MSQVDSQQQQQQQRAGDQSQPIESEQTKLSAGGKKNKRAAQKSADCKTHALIDAANVAKPAIEEGQEQQKQKLQQQQQQRILAERANLEVSRSQVARKLASGPPDEFDKSNYQSDELNNNSIAPSKQATLETQPQPPPPVGLLTGLRMQSSNSNRAAAQRSAEQAPLMPGERRKPPTSKNLEPQASATARASSPTRASPSNTTALSTNVSYVESSLNPVEGAPTPANKPYVPSYTSIFSSQRQSLLSSPSPDQPQQQQQQRQPQIVPIARLSATTAQPSALLTATTATTTPGTSVTSYSQQRQLITESIQTSSSTSRHQQTSATSRSPLIKQPAQQQQHSSELSSRSLFSTSSKPSEQSTRRLPSIFNHKSGRLKEPVDYDDLKADRRRRLLREQAGGNIINFDSRTRREEEEEEEEDEDDEEDEEEEVSLDEGDDDLDYRERGLDDYSGSSAYSASQREGHLQGSVSQQATERLVSSSPESQKKGRHQFLTKYPGSSSRLTSSASNRRPSPARPNQSAAASKIQMGAQEQVVIRSGAGSKKLAHMPPQSQSQTRISIGDSSRPPPFNASALQHRQHQLDLDMKAASCRKLDLLEQVAHLDCSCTICAKNRKLAGLHDDLYHQYRSQAQLANSAAKMSNFNLNKSVASEKNYPKTRFVHMVLKSIILVLCTLLLLLLLVGTLLISHYLPQSMDKVVNASRSFNVTIAGRR